MSIEISEEYATSMKQRLQELTTKLIPETKNAFNEARKAGDLRENAEFETAKKSLEGYYAEVEEIKRKLSDSIVVRPAIFTLKNMNMPDAQPLVVGLTDIESHPPTSTGYGLVSRESKVGRLLSSLLKQGGNIVGRDLKYTDNLLRKQHFKIVDYLPGGEINASGIT